MLKENGYVKRGWCDDITNIINEVLKEPSSIAHKCWLSRKTLTNMTFIKLLKSYVRTYTDFDVMCNYY